MRNKLIYCIPLALSITCLIGCAAKAAQMPAEPEPVALLPEQKQSSIVTNDAKNETIPTPQQSEHEENPVRIVESNPADTPANADTEVPQAASAPTTQPNVTEDIPSETVHAKTGYVEPEPAPDPDPEPVPEQPDPSEDAAEKLTQMRPEAVLLDAREACDDTERRVRGLRDKAEPGTVIIVLISCDSDMPEGIHGYGADGVLRAPLFLSRLSDAVSHAREEDAGEEIKSPLAGMRFLCAEDNELNAEILTELLHIYSAECRVFGNGL